MSAFSGQGRLLPWHPQKGCGLEMAILDSRDRVFALDGGEGILGPGFGSTRGRQDRDDSCSPSPSSGLRAAGLREPPGGLSPHLTMSRYRTVPCRISMQGKGSAISFLPAVLFASCLSSLSSPCDYFVGAFVHRYSLMEGPVWSFLFEKVSHIAGSCPCQVFQGFGQRLHFVA
jgi:hypothetical protein